jgi:hypothetical protein
LAPAQVLQVLGQRGGLYPFPMMLKDLQEPLHENRYHFWRGGRRKSIYDFSRDNPYCRKGV